jgi:hypothetical protein
MGFAVIQIESGPSGEEASRRPVAANLQTKQQALMAAQEIAEAYEKHGFKREHDFWWYRDGEKLVRLLVVE